MLGVHGEAHDKVMTKPSGAYSSHFCPQYVLYVDLRNEGEQIKKILRNLHGPAACL
jgi:hypothetical protein